MAQLSDRSTPHSPPLVPPDPRQQIQTRIQEVSATIDEKRRYLLRNDRAFVREKIRQLQGAIAPIIQILEGKRLLPPLVEAIATNIATNKDAISSQPPISTPTSTSTPLTEATDVNLSNMLPQQKHIHQYLMDEHAIPLEAVIRLLRSFVSASLESGPLESAQLESAQLESAQLESGQEGASFASIQPMGDTSPVEEAKILAELATIEDQLDRLLELQHWPLTKLWQGEHSLSFQPLWDQIKQATDWIELLRINARLEVAGALNQLKILLGRIYLYSNTHGVLYVKRWGWRWRLPSGALLSAVEQVNLAISDAEWGSGCSVTLLQDTEVTISRMMYRYEYGLPFKWPVGWLINRVNDGKRLVMSIKRWHDSDRNEDSTIVKSKILLGLALTSFFWILLFVTVSGLTLIAKIGIELLTPSSVQRAVADASGETELVGTNVEKRLTLYQTRLQENLVARIEDKNRLIERSLSTINYLIDDSLPRILSKISAPALQPVVPTIPSIPSAEPDVPPSPSTTQPDPAPASPPNNGPPNNGPPDNGPPDNGTTNVPNISVLPSNSVETSLKTLTVSCQFEPLLSDPDRTACAQAINAAQTALDNDQNLKPTTVDELSDILELLTQNLSNIATYTTERRELQNQQAIIEEEFASVVEELLVSIQNLQPINQAGVEQVGKISGLGGRIWKTLFSWSKDDVFNGNLNRIMLALLAGAIGSVISLLIRINDLEPRQLSAPFLLGLFQPFIGAVTSVVVVAILSTDAVDVINIFPEQLQLRETREVLDPAAIATEGGSGTTITATRSNPVGRLDTHEVYKILIIGFFVGFSERLAKDALGRLNTSRMG